MKLKEYCECGGQMIGTITPDAKGFEMIQIFWRIHSGKGHSAVEPSECYHARRRAELKIESYEKKEGGKRCQEN